jgi:RNA polymerase sigma-70 factor (ECF subfamily)
MLAFEALVLRKTPAVIAVARRIVGNVEDARDVAQMAFLRVWEQLSRYDETYSFNTWLYRIATNLSIDFLRSSRSREKAHTATLHLVRQRESQTGNETSRAAEDDSASRLFQRVSGRLTGKQKAAFVLREMGDLDTREITGILAAGITVRNTSSTRGGSFATRSKDLAGLHRAARKPDEESRVTLSCRRVRPGSKATRGEPRGRGRAPCARHRTVRRLPGKRRPTAIPCSSLPPTGRRPFPGDGPGPAAVRAGIALKRKRLEGPAARRRVGALASAAAALAVTLLAPGAPKYRAPSPSSFPRAEREAVKANYVPAGNPAPAPASDILEKTGGTGKFPAEATIYELNPGAGQPRVVWIVDRSIDI